MATVDLYGADAQRLRSQYKTSLGRDASDDEISGWLSGSFGGGGVDQYLQQIAGSHEAQQRRPAETPRQSAPTPPTAPVVGQNPTGPMGADPWQQARQGLANVYQTTLGRQARPDEIEGWLSGQFGHGSGVQDYDKYVTAIMSSPEARAYRPPQTLGQDAYKSIEYWQQQGVPTIDIFDPMTGQIKPGWQRTARGYERTGGGAGPTGGPAGGPQSLPGDPQAFFMQLTGGRAPTPEQLEALAPELAKYGIRLGSKGNRGWTDTIILPDGRTFDVIRAAGIGTGQEWVWQQNGGPGYVPRPEAPGDQYNDPYTQFLEQILKGRIGSLGEGVNDPYRQQLMSAYQQRANALGSAAEPQYQALIQRMEQRFNDLQGPGYTGAEGEAIRTQALDPIENDRAAAKKRIIERMAAMGHTMESGTMQQAINEVDKAFDGMRATTQTTLATTDVQRREGRQQRADAIKGALYDIPQARAREQLDVFGAMQMLEGIMQQEQDSRGREQVSLSGALADLGPQRLQLAMQAAGMGGNPSSYFGNLMQLANLNQQGQMLNMNRSSQLWSGLGSIAAILANAGR